ncbi:MAG: TolC family protein, partial [Bacteroidetes bacterium]|nr:TolC family protein [Bacteroidota bacterium]
IDVPAGDLVNPVYKTLNQLTGSNSFPQISNVSEQLNPNNFYDVRIKTTMPVYNPDIRYNRTIRQQQTGLQQQEIDTYKRELIKEVKQAYYNYLSAGKAVTIYESALQVVNQNLRVNQSLLANGKGLPAYVSRAESEVKQVESQLQNAGNDRYNASAYFNFLLNRPLTDSIIITDIEVDDSLLPALESNNVNGREELKSLALAKDINNNVLKMNQSFRTPHLNAFLDLGAQGFDFKVQDKSFFYLGGLQLTLPIFSGHRNEYKVQQAQLDGKNIQLTADQTRQQLELAALVSRNNIFNAWNNYRSAQKQGEAAQKYFTLIDKGYREGVNSFIEFLDARNQLTTAQLQVNIQKYRVLTTLADYERQTASYTLNQ